MAKIVHKEITVTPRLLEALRIIADGYNDGYGIRPRSFGEKFWKDHVMHTQMSNCGRNGNGGQRGAVGWKCAGSYLGKLRKKELITFAYHDGDRLTVLGEEILREYEIKRSNK